MANTNESYLKNVDIEGPMECKCTATLEIVHTSNWHDGTGVFYTQCPECGRQYNVRWKSKNEKR